MQRMPNPTERTRGLWQRIPTPALQFLDLQRERRWLLWFAVLYIGASVATGLAIRAYPLPFWGAESFTQDLWYIVPFKLVLLLTLPILVYRRWGYRLRDLAYGWEFTPRSGLVMVLCYGLGVVINAGRFAEIGTAWTTHSMLEAVARLSLGLALPFLMAGIPEEVVYRGLLQTRLEASWGRVAAIVVSVLLFTAWHLPTRYFNAHDVEGQAGDFISVLLGTGAPVAIAGLILALAWDRWRNLPALIAFHAGVDTLPIVSSMLQAIPLGHR